MATSHNLPTKRKPATQQTFYPQISYKAVCYLIQTASFIHQISTQHDHNKQQQLYQMDELFRRWAIAHWLWCLFDWRIHLTEGHPCRGMGLGVVWDHCPLCVQCWRELFWERGD